MQTSSNLEPRSKKGRHAAIADSHEMSAETSLAVEQLSSSTGSVLGMRLRACATEVSRSAAS